VADHRRHHQTQYDSPGGVGDPQNETMKIDAVKLPDKNDLGGAAKLTGIDEVIFIDLIDVPG
jgi:hypothetical protein